MNRVTIRRLFQATPERLFNAWTDPAELKRWWGPASVICIVAEIDLRVGGAYRIGNQFPDGAVVWISGEFEYIERPWKLVYTWRLGSEADSDERVTVVFTRRPGGAEIEVTHERIADPARRDRHEQGWIGCLEGLRDYLGGDSPPCRQGGV
jgi:uncharacterized protein YndB with AHSA1/START domain